MAMSDDADAIVTPNASAMHRICFWMGLLGLLLGFVVFSLLMTAMLAIRVMEGDAQMPDLRQVLYVIWILVRHGVPLLLWITFRRKLANVPATAMVILAIGCWLYSLTFLYVLMNPVQW